MKENRATLVKAIAFGTSIATTLAGLVGGGFLLGRYLDARFGSSPWLQLLAMFGGIVLGGAYLVSTLRKFGNTDEQR